MGSQLQRINRIGQRKTMADQLLQIHFAAKYEPRRFFLQIDRSAIRSQETLFVDTNAGWVDDGLSMLRLPEQKHSPARTGCFRSGSNQAVPCDGQNDGVSPSAFRQLLDCADRVGGRGVDVLVQAERLSNCKPLRIQIGSDYSRPTPSRQYRQDDADRPLTNHQYSFDLHQAQRLDAFHACIDRLNERRLHKGHVVGDANHATTADNPIHYADVLSESSAAGFVAGRGANLLVGWALRN